MQNKIKIMQEHILYYDEYINRSLEEENLTYEQFCKIHYLRCQLENKTKFTKNSNKLPINTAVRVFIKFTDKTGTHSIVLNGYIHSINENNYFKPYVINVSGKLIEEYEWISVRKVNDFSNVVICDEIKQLPTEKLLNKFRQDRKNLYCGFPTYSENYTLQMKAELSNRENIESKYEKKYLNSLK